jgi:hypothetical protein
MRAPAENARPPLPSLNLTDVLTLIIAEIAGRVPSYRHVDPSRTLVCVGTNRNGRGAIFGKLVPLRFRDGAETVRHGGRIYRMPRVLSGDIEQLYVIYFYFPRFFDLEPFEKLRVIFHELHHIHPGFNGDIRRMGKVRASHGSSRERFESHFEDDLHAFHEYIRHTPYMNFLSLNTALMRGTFSRIKARRLKVPRPSPEA